ncbi:hypothetical protein P170DRAFT_407467 [Aspergillus steynii IBT 23096]|uniref:Nephrocystin 3-like N-terminal domain-containing protein n=1 Tax=Aspergillus steynii IBT 23096 TaxID=1392250 RepID=A0A2I2G7D7_9EURO|nr:uncharacterized protein P170DRAFT_407467 [Aspergillus steynii IBT 23096]PLB48790.1 hypothetical protein P170DRAFT_407467 [Aspergillus steynii IBT 23096]
MEKAQHFTGDYRSEQHQLNGNNFYGNVSFSAPPQRDSVSTNDRRKISPWINDESDETSGFGLDKCRIWDACLDSLRSEELNDREQSIDRHHDGTFEWLFNSPEYVRWIAEHGLLLIRGKPGCGKSTLMRFALEKQMDYAATSECIVLSFFFHARGTKLQNGIMGLFRSLLLQLLDQDDSSQTTFKEICRKRWVTGGKKKLHMDWNEQELQVNLQKMVLECSARREITIFVDAIDGCRDQDRDRVIKFFHILKGRAQPRLSRPRICFACRPYPDGQIDADFYVRLEERNQHDIEIFVEQELRLPDETSEDAEALKNILRSRADGMFLWLVLVIPRVHEMSGKGLSSKSIQSEILQCPRELNGLYEGLLRGIEDHELREACSLFQWICFSIRPLCLDELRIAMNIQLSGMKVSLREYEDQDNPNYIPNEAKMKKRMIYLSRGLVEMTSAKSKEGKLLIGFGHETIKDFLLKKGLGYLGARLKQTQSLVKEANFQLGNTCLRYLSTQEICNIEKPTAFSDTFGFLCYAATFWVSHAVAAEREGCGECIAWPNRSFLETWINVCNGAKYDVPGGFKEGTTLMHIAAVYGLETLARRIVGQNAQENKRPSTNRWSRLQKCPNRISTLLLTTRLTGRKDNVDTTLYRSYRQPNKSKE